MEKLLSVVQVTLSILMISTILLQQRGAALSGAFGGSGGIYRSRRGVEKILFNATIIFAVLFAAAMILDLVI